MCKLISGWCTFSSAAASWETVAALGVEPDYFREALSRLSHRALVLIASFGNQRSVNREKLKLDIEFESLSLAITASYPLSDVSVRQYLSS